MINGKLSIIMPIHNESGTLREIIRRIEAVHLPVDHEIVLVENGSSDGSREIVLGLCQNKRYKGVVLEHKVGKGAAIVQGLLHAEGEIILIQDADLEYDPRDYRSLLAPLFEEKSKFVLGSRALGAGTWRIRKFVGMPFYEWTLNLGSLFLNFIFFALYGVKLSDPQSMAKAFRRECLDGISLRSRGFDIDWELVCKLVKKGFIPVEIPISYRSRTHADGKKIRIFPDAWLALFAIFHFRLSD